MSGKNALMDHRLYRRGWTVRRVVAAGVLGLGLIGLGSSGARAAQSDEATIAAGKAIALNGVEPRHPGCASCHGEDGAGKPYVGIPRLAGLPKDYLAAQLGYFAKGTRYNVVMTPYAKALSTAQLQQAVAYFASLPAVVNEDLPSITPGQAKLAKQLYLNGNDVNQMVACAQCHGPTGQGVLGFSPPISGQSPAYIYEQLIRWHGGEARDPEGAFMLAEATNLNPTEIEALSMYVAGLDEPKKAK